jgi:hypothetical protein
VERHATFLVERKNGKRGAVYRLAVPKKSIARGVIFTRPATAAGPPAPPIA